MTALLSPYQPGSYVNPRIDCAVLSGFSLSLVPNLHAGRPISPDSRRGWSLLAALPTFVRHISDILSQ